MALKKTSQLLPEVFQTNKNNKFLNATLDQIISDDNKKKFSGFIAFGASVISAHPKL